MIYHLLGELTIGVDKPLELPGGHNLVVLAALLVNANQRLSKTELLKAAWGSEDVSEAQLHKSVAALRAMLDQIGRRDDLVTHARHGYQIRVGDDELDMLAFRRLLEQAEQARSQRQVDEEVTLLRQALGLWRGPHPLANVPRNALKHETDGLEQRRKRAAGRLYDIELARGNHEDVLDELAVVAGYYPDDGRLSEQLMIACYRCGHVVDATAAYDRHAAALAEEIGGQPDPALRDLNYAIASGDEQAVQAAASAFVRRAGLPGEEAGLGRLPAVPRQLPPNPVDLVGRDDLVAETVWLLVRQPRRAAPVVVVCGAGGIGKTALARRAAHMSAEHYLDGQLYMDMRGTAGQPTSPGDALAQFLRSLGLPVVPESLAERVAAYRTLLADRRVLVVLDDVADGAQVRELIPASSGCGVLMTSRRRLPGIDGAHHVPTLAPLSRAAATELFLRATEHAGVDLRAEHDAVGKVVALCGGLPLALRIAAALRVHYHPRPTAELASRLARQGPDAFAYEEQSVARSIGAGFERLDDDARGLFLQLGLLVLPTFGPWTAPALLDGTGVDAVAAMSQLAASYMVEPAEPAVRYRFHDLTRGYAARRAAAELAGQDARLAGIARAYQGLLTLTRRAHVAVCGGDFEVVHSAVPGWAAPPALLAEVDADASGWFELERPNIRAAVEHCAELGLVDICWDLAVSAHELCNVGGYFDDWRATHVTALRACRAAGELRGEGVVLACLGQPALVASRREDTSDVAALERSVRLLAECGDRHGQAIALRTLANALRRRGQLARPLALFTEALGHYEVSADLVGQSQTLRFIGQTHLDQGDYAQALKAFGAAQVVAVTLGQQRVLAQTSYWIGQACLATGDVAGAAAAFEVMLDAYPEPTGIAHGYAVHGLGDVALRTGSLADAQRHLDLAVRLASDGSDGSLEGMVWLSAAELHRVLGQLAERTAALERAAALFVESGASYLQVRALAGLAEAHQEAGDDSAARAAWARVDDIYAELAVPQEDRAYRGGPV